MAENAPQLDYAPGAPIRRRKRVRRIVLLIVLLALIYPGYHFGPPAARKAKLLYLQRRCLTYSAAADQVVYDQESATTAERLKTAGYEVILPDFGTVAPIAVPGIIPDQLKDFSDYLPSVMFRGALLFMHERVSKTGVRRLVVVQRAVVPNEEHYIYVFGIRVELIEPATFTQPPGRIDPPGLMTGMEHDGRLVRPPTKGLRFYAGQVDANDEAHFLIRYELEGKSGTIDGRLNDKGDDVTLRVVDGPALGTVWVTRVVP